MFRSDDFASQKAHSNEKTQLYRKMLDSQIELNRRYKNVGSDERYLSPILKHK